MISHYSFFNDTDLVNASFRGVYALYHVDKPREIYIGYTFCEQGFRGRLRHHVSFLKRNKHSSKALQSIINENGLYGFRIKILKICNSLKECAEEELKFIKDLKPKCNNNIGNKNVIVDNIKNTINVLPYQKENKNWPIVLFSMEIGDIYSTSHKNVGSIRCAQQAVKSKIKVTILKDRDRAIITRVS